MDISNFGEKGPKEALTGNEDGRWWSLEGDAAAESISATLKRLRDSQSARLSQFTVAARLYGNLSTFAVAGQAASRYAQAYSLMREQGSGYNAIQSAADTIVAKMAKNRPRPYFLTSSGNYTEQRKAQKASRFIEGVFYEQKAYALGVECVRDGAVGGDGVAHVFAEYGRIKYERVLATELWVDEQEALYGVPRQMHRTKLLDRLVLLEAVSEWHKTSPKEEREQAVGWVKDADPAKADSGSRQDTSDLIEVRESWHLPSGPKPTKENPKGGKHVISIAGHALMEEPWLRDHFPFARFRWCPRLVGYWSQGGAEQTQRLQFQLNKLSSVVDRSFDLGGTFTWLLENSARVPVEHINNRIGKIIRYNGPNKPEVITPTLVQAEIFQRALQIKQDIFEQFGVSQLSANAQKPAGLNSGVALREYNDIESDRFQTIGKSYEDFFLQLAQLTIETAQELGKSYRVKAPSKRFIEEVQFDLPDEWVMQCFPVSSLPRDPAGRLQTIQEYMQAGLLTPRQGKKLLDFPDLDHVEDLTNAAENYLSEIIDGMLGGGPFQNPDPEDDLDLAEEMILEYIAFAKTQHADEERIEMLRRFRSQIFALKQSAQQMAAAQQPVTPQAQPEAPPTSNLIANAPGLQPQAAA